MMKRNNKNSKNAVAILRVTPAGLVIGSEADVVIGEPAILLMADGDIIQTSPVESWKYDVGKGFTLCTKNSTYEVAVDSRTLDQSAKQLTNLAETKRVFANALKAMK